MEVEFQEQDSCKYINLVFWSGDLRLSEL
jgi:hypothetical protein